MEQATRLELATTRMEISDSTIELRLQFNTTISVQFIFIKINIVFFI